MHVLKPILISIVALLSACASNPSNKALNQTTLKKEQRAAASPEPLHMTGRFSIRIYPKDAHNDEQNQNHSLHGNFEWVQTNHSAPIHIPENTKVTLLSPFKQTLAVIDLTPQIATLTQVGKIPKSAPDADTLVTNILGWPLPISGLRYWLQGNAVKVDGSTFYANPENNLVTTQDGWQIHYISWEEDEHTNNKKPYQPKRIDLTRMIPALGEITIRIMIDSRQ